MIVSRHFFLSVVASVSLLISSDAYVGPRALPTRTVVQLPAKRSTSSQSLSMSATTVPLSEPFGKGLKDDLKRKAPVYKSEFTDGLNLKSLSAVFFLFFACTAPAVAFGGLLARATNGLMGTVEAVGATAIGGIVYALFSGQPLTIIGTTGPLLAFLKVLFDACNKANVPFLPVYAWTGLWSSLLLFLSSFFSLSNVVEYFTRFTDDIFSSLISVIFISEAVRDIVRNFSNPAVSGLQAFVSTSISLITFLTANVLVNIRSTPFLARKVRNFVADFAPVTGVIVGLFAAAKATASYGLALPTLNVPEVLGTTIGRPWLVDIMSVSNKVKLLCLLPAIMAYILLFMDQNITVRLVMSKENKLKKGNGIHLDMFVTAVITAFFSMTGMPWMVAATVRSLAHVRALKQYETVKTGDDKSELVTTGVLEQRFSALMIHSLIGLALVFGRSGLRQIPNAVLTGVFLYLGISSIDKTELWQRTLLFFQDDRDASKAPRWMKAVSIGRTKVFTSIQLALLYAMWWIKGTPLGVFFPVLIGLLAPVRIALEKLGVFSNTELDALDGEIA